MLKTLFFTTVLTLFLTSCSTRESYKPENTDGSISLSERFDSAIIDVNSETATFEEGMLLTKEGIDTTLFPEGYRFVFRNKEWSLALKTGGKVFAVKNANISRSLDLLKTVATASLQGDLLAVVFADNELALYEFSTGTLLFKEPASESTAVDMRIATPRFLNDLVLFPTLDGKIVIVNSNTKELVRTIIVSSEQYFNNIIYFNLVNDTLFAATPSKIYTLGEKEVRVELEIRDVVVNGKGVWVTTKQGELIALDHNLEILNRLKFPFAHFLGLIVTDDRIYAAEKEEYIIVAPTNLAYFTIYDIDLESGFFFTSDEGFYFDNVCIKVK